MLKNIFYEISALKQKHSSTKDLQRCHGCKFHFEDCFEKKYCNFCLQKTQINEEGFEGTAEFSVPKAFHNEYMLQVHCDLKEKYGYYGYNHDIMLDIPRCMMTGSLNDTLAGTCKL